jgi:hypothetical protein
MAKIKYRIVTQPRYYGDNIYLIQFWKFTFFGYLRFWRTLGDYQYYGDFGPSKFEEETFRSVESAKMRIQELEIERQKEANTLAQNEKKPTQQVIWTTTIK